MRSMEKPKIELLRTAKRSSSFKSEDLSTDCSQYRRSSELSWWDGKKTRGSFGEIGNEGANAKAKPSSDAIQGDPRLRKSKSASNLREGKRIFTAKSDISEMIGQLRLVSSADDRTEASMISNGSSLQLLLERKFINAKERLKAVVK